MKQQTLAKPAQLAGVGLHTGATVTLRIEPAHSGGFQFQRTDLPGSEPVPARADLVADTRRGTSLARNGVEVHTVEHLLAALAGLGVHHARILLDGPEVPILDGSALPFAEAILAAGLSEVGGQLPALSPAQPVVVTAGKSSVSILAAEHLEISCVSADDRGFHCQEASWLITPEVFLREIAPARTFTFFEDIAQLLASGKIKGGSLDCAIVVKDGVAQANGGLRFPDEFVRHKILDLIGDLALAGPNLRARVSAIRPGHTLNNQAARKLLPAATPAPASKAATPAAAAAAAPVEPTAGLDIRQILGLLPHRFPFVMLDRILEFRGTDEIIARKCVTVNEPYFPGHFPDQPVMPGVLQIEALAQAAGILLLRKLGLPSADALFLSVDKAKFRKAVVPGDVLTLHVKLTKVRGLIGVAEGVCTVDAHVVSSAELMFTLLERK